MSRRLTVVSVALLLAGPLHAQPRVRVDPDLRKGVVSLNPFAVFAEYLAGDVEVKASRALTLGVGGSISSTDNFDGYGALEAKARYYPNEKALQGFSVAGTIGFASAQETRYDFTREALTRTRVARPSVGTELSYQWILGPSARFVAVSGIGLKRFLGDNKDVDPLSIPLVPTARINIGFAF